jgi:hypothetical protein
MVYPKFTPHAPIPVRSSFPFLSHCEGALSRSHRVRGRPGQYRVDLRNIARFEKRYIPGDLQRDQARPLWACIVEHEPAVNLLRHPAEHGDRSGLPQPQSVLGNAMSASFNTQRDAVNGIGDCREANIDHPNLISERQRTLDVVQVFVRGKHGLHHDIDALFDACGDATVNFDRGTEVCVRHERIRLQQLARPNVRVQCRQWMSDDRLDQPFFHERCFARTIWSGNDPEPWRSQLVLRRLPPIRG